MDGESDNPDKLADDLEREADQLQRHSDQLAGEIDEVRQDWDRKRRDQAVPGAPALEGATEQDAPNSPSPQVSEEGRNAPADREADDAPAEESG